MQLYETVVLSQSNSWEKNDSYATNLKDIAMINLCNFPEPNIDFLSDVVSLTNDFKKCEQLIEETFVKSIRKSYRVELCDIHKHRCQYVAKGGFYDNFIFIKSDQK